MDVFESSYGDSKRVRDQLPSLSRQSVAGSLETKSAEATEAGETERRASHRTLEERSLAFPQKRAMKEGRTIVFCDQSGFYLLPRVVRTYAPVGKTPILREHLTPDHLLRR